MERNKPIYFAFDSDVIRTLAHLDLLKSKNKEIDFSNSEDRLLCKYKDTFLKMFIKKINIHNI